MNIMIVNIFDILQRYFVIYLLLYFNYPINLNINVKKI